VDQAQKMTFAALYKRYQELLKRKKFAAGIFYKYSPKFQFAGIKIQQSSLKATLDKKSQTYQQTS